MKAAVAPLAGDDEYALHRISNREWREANLQDSIWTC